MRTTGATAEVPFRCGKRQLKFAPSASSNAVRPGRPGHDRVLRSARAASQAPAERHEAARLFFPLSLTNTSKFDSFNCRPPHHNCCSAGAHFKFDTAKHTHKIILHCHADSALWRNSLGPSPRWASLPHAAQIPAACCMCHRLHSSTTKSLLEQQHACRKTVSTAGAW